MIQFLKESYCNGLPPVDVSSSGMFERNALVSRMMLAKGKIKVLCAPTMLGKTSLAYQYAKAARSFCDVLWVDASHPRFLRGLYEGRLADAIDGMMPEEGMVVFEDVPRLAYVERGVFEEVCRSLASSGIDVTVTCVPGCELFGSGGEDCEFLYAEDLLYSDEELARLRHQGYLPIGFQGPLSRTERIPGLLNHPSGSVEAFLLAQQSEAENAFQRLLTYALLMLSGGTMEEISYVMGTSVSTPDLLASSHRPYVCELDFGTGFVADGFPLGDVLRVFRNQAPRFFGSVLSGGHDAFACRVANLLLRRRAVDRATRVMVEACGPEMRLSWAARNLERMVQSSAPLNALLLCRSLDPQDIQVNKEMLLWEGVSYLLLNETGAALCRFEGIVRDPGSDLGLRLTAASFAALASDGHPALSESGARLGDACLRMRKQGASETLLRVWNSMLDGDSGMEELLEQVEKGDCSGSFLLALACCLRSVSVQQQEVPLLSGEAKALDTLLEHVGKVMEDRQSVEECEATVFLLRKELDAVGSGPYLSRSAVSAFDQIIARIRVQRSAFGRLSSAPAWDGAPASSRFMQESGRLRGSSASVMSIPLLEVRMFGSFEVLIGGQPVGRDRLSRLKAKSLLVLLALEPGKDFSCDRLASLLWPESAEDKARKNFYSIFSILKRALSLEDGGCPYLSRTQGICRLNAPYIRTDALEIAEICQRMRHADISGGDAVVLLERLRAVYRGELLPSDSVVNAVESARRVWRNRVVDALILAARRLRDASELSLALEFADFAFDCDSQREDACELVMTLQYSMKQRAGAIETFLEYQQTNRELGLDPSYKMRELYDRIINDDATLGDWE